MAVSQPLFTLTPAYERALNYIAGLLPLPEYAGGGLLDGAELQATMPDLPHLRGEQIEAGKRYLITSEYATEQHYAALVEAYQTAGPTGVVGYLLPYAAFLPEQVFTMPSPN